MDIQIIALIFGIPLLIALFYELYKSNKDTKQKDKYEIWIKGLADKSGIDMYKILVRYSQEEIKQLAQQYNYPLLNMDNSTKEIKKIAESLALDDDFKELNKN